uniref:tRNA-dihydrouridine(16/17) synthase [NAD(P)(+)] n=1 Tax=Romanomermis culicivorax TaxID=13658 RepID=A0A915L9K2_ROMCU
MAEGDVGTIPDNDAFKFWKTTLKAAKFILAPMVDQSELAWRLLSRRHNAHLCYTPMFHAQNFVNDAIYRRDNFQTCAEDRPLIVQFCANDPNTFAKACQLVENDCDAVDLNLGCPQTIAKRGHYGAFLQDEWSLIEGLVKSAKEKVRVPICCKIRVFDCTERTIQYAKMLEKAGCQFLVVHGRTRDQKGRNTGVADWSKIKAVKEAVSIPVIANGNIQYYADLQRCLNETGAHGIMSAEGNLHNPYIFEDRPDLPACWEPALEYLDLVDQYPCSMTFVRGHLFKLFHFCMLKYTDLREKMAVASTLDDCRSVALELKSRTQEEHASYLERLKSEGNVNTSCDMEYFWLCRPYEQDNPSTSNQTDNNKDQITSDSKRQILAIKRKHQEEVERLSEQYGLSKNKAKKLMRFPSKNPQNMVNNNESKKPAYNKCLCGNPLSIDRSHNSGLCQMLLKSEADKNYDKDVNLRVRCTLLDCHEFD